MSSRQLLSVLYKTLPAKPIFLFLHCLFNVSQLDPWLQEWRQNWVSLVFNCTQNIQQRSLGLTSCSRKYVYTIEREHNRGPSDRASSSPMCFSKSAHPGIVFSSLFPHPVSSLFAFLSFLSDITFHLALILILFLLKYVCRCLRDMSNVNVRIELDCEIDWLEKCKHTSGCVWVGIISGPVHLWSTRFEKLSFSEALCHDASSLKPDD